MPVREATPTLTCGTPVVTISNVHPIPPDRVGLTLTNATIFSRTEFLMVDAVVNGVPRLFFAGFTLAPHSSQVVEIQIADTVQSYSIRLCRTAPISVIESPDPIMPITMYIPD